MDIYVLMENTPFQPEFVAEHGLSLYIETEQHKILFDTGRSGRFVDNAARLGVCLADVDIVVLSHGHYDHGGGLRRFLELNDHAPIYLSECAFGEYYHGQRYIGLDMSLKGNARLVSVSSSRKIDGELSLDSCNSRERHYPGDDAGLLEKKEEEFFPDAFLHEQYLTIQESGRKVVVSGCSHKGILNIVDWLRPDVLIGGFHFMEQKIPEQGNPFLDQAAEILSGYDCTYYTCHCTGRDQYKYLKDRMGSRIHSLASGQVVMV